MSERNPDDFETRRSRPVEPPRPGAGARPASERIPSLKGAPDRTRRAKPDTPSDQETTVRRQRPDLPSPPNIEPPDESGPGLTVPWWAFVIVILAVAAITCGMWYLVLANRGGLSTDLGPSPTPIFVVITSTPTLGPAEGEATEEATTQAPTAEPTNTLPPTVAADITLGSQVAIKGTEGAGLAVRQGPGVEYTYFFVANDGERFVVEDGPREADGYIWWYIADPSNPDREGWAAQNWMEIAQPEP
jgi:hypothetical protein